MWWKKSSRVVTALAMVAAISLSLWFASPVKAVTVTLPTMPTSMYTGTTYTIVAQIDTQTNEAPPFTALTFAIVGPSNDSVTFDVGGTITVAGTHVSAVSRVYEDYVIAYGGYYLGQSGYAYTDVAYAVNTMFKYNITLNTTSMVTGDYTAQLTVNDSAPSQYTSPTYSFTVSSQQAAGGSAPVTGGNTNQSTSLPGFTGSSTLTINSSTGVVATTFTATSEDGKTTLNIPAGTVAKNLAGAPISTLTADPVTPPAPPAGHNVIGLAYDFGPNGTTFDPAIEISYTLSPDDIPPGLTAADMVIAYFDTATNSWVELSCTVDGNVVTAAVSHYTTFAVIAPPAQPSAAAFSTSDLTITPSEIDSEETVNISVVVTNSGDQSGSYFVTFKVNNAILASQEVTVDGGASTTVAFTATGDGAGTYQVDVNGLTGSFTVKAVEEPTPTPPTTPEPTPTPTPPAANWYDNVYALGGAIAAAVIIIGLIIWLAVRRRGEA